MMNPIAPVHLDETSQIRASFLSERPFPRFAVVPDFLRRDVVEEALAGCKRGRFETYCSFANNAEGTELRSEYREPDEESYYVTIHERSRERIPAIDRLKELFSAQETIEALNEMTGAGVTRLYEPDVLIHWNPGSFLEQHTDNAPHAHFRLVVSMSLTEEWDPAFGGATVYSWRGTDRAVRLQPRFNTAVLFVPFSGSDHWVEQVSNEAPPRTRFTWTAFFA